MTVDTNTNITDENKQIQQNNIETPASDVQETQEQINWKKFRQQREEELKKSREAEELARRKAEEAEALKAALEAVLNKQPQQNTYVNNSYETEDDEETIFKKRMEKLLAEREAQYRKELEQQEKQQLPVKLQQTFGDFQNVCTQENLDYLEFHYPEIATAFQHMPDNFDKWSSVYKAVKRFVPNTNGQKAIQKIEQNLNKPQSLNTGLSSTSDTTPHIYLDEDKKKANWNRMKKLAKGL